jgi:hypothetical protein
VKQIVQLIFVGLLRLGREHIQIIDCSAIVVASASDSAENANGVEALFTWSCAMSVRECCLLACAVAGYAVFDSLSTCIDQ